MLRNRFFCVTFLLHLASISLPRVKASRLAKNSLRSGWPGYTPMHNYIQVFRGLVLYFMLVHIIHYFDGFVKGVKRNKTKKIANISDFLSNALMSYYGLKRPIVRGKGIHSRICSTPVIQRTVRSSPIPNPECGTLPYFLKSKYH